MHLPRPRGGAVVAFVLLVTVLAFVHGRLYPFAFDDAYIHFRIARHLAEHAQPYYNLGDAVMASSSSAWTLVLAALFKCGATPFTIAMLNALLTACCVPLYAQLMAVAAEDLEGWIHQALAAAIVVPALLMASVGLMETPLALLVAAAAMRLFQRGRAQAFALFGVAAFVRPEMAVLGAAFAVIAVAERRMGAVEIVAWGLAGALPFIAYDLYFFHTVIPNTIRAKSLGYQLQWSDSLPRLVPSLADSPALRDWGVAGVVAIVLSLALVWRAAVEVTARASFLAGLAIAALYVIPRGFIFEWYVPLYVVPMVWPVAAVCSGARRAGEVDWARRGIAAAALAVLVLPSWLPLRAFADGALVNPALAPLFAQGARARQYIEVGAELARRYPGATLLSSEVGGLGEGFPGRIEDGFGLISPAALRFHPMAVPQERSSGTLGAIPPAFVQQVNPELIVSYNVFAEALERSPILARYRRVRLPLFSEGDARTAAAVGVPRTLWGAPVVLDVWVRNDVAAVKGIPFAAAAQAGPHS